MKKYELYGTLSLVFGTILDKDLIPCGVKDTQFFRAFEAENDNEAQQKITDEIEQWKNQLFPTMIQSSTEENKLLDVPTVEADSSNS